MANIKATNVRKIIKYLPATLSVFLFLCISLVAYHRHRRDQSLKIVLRFLLSSLLRFIATH